MSLDLEKSSEEIANEAFTAELSEIFAPAMGKFTTVLTSVLGSGDNEKIIEIRKEDGRVYICIINRKDIITDIDCPAEAMEVMPIEEYFNDLSNIKPK